MFRRRCGVNGNHCLSDVGCSRSPNFWNGGVDEMMLGLLWMLFVGSAISALGMFVNGLMWQTIATTVICGICWWEIIQYNLNRD